MTSNKQHLTYTITEGVYCGYFTNHKQVSGQGDSLEELLECCTKGLIMWLEFSKECLDNGIETKEVDLDAFLK